ncbi:MAG: multicopper oxidase domain-containing protein [Sediminibacterium magnilacihabitans]|jgi:blue copper oxidase|nr:multicopper oxidase domain-containing protein [Sediminibacterium magnilacihabitans]PQV61864.1 FtsP/CotA-like multicopper oxidase with cupredoxin domain [Sediminibacterium magnilacihabitans]HET9056339.1 multicopper oxidase domain-containing protein [Chitinophagaceae bacterium]
MKRRDFIKNTGIGAGSVLTAGSFMSLLASCNKNSMMGGNMNMGGQPVPVTEGSFTRLLPIPNTVTGTTSLIAQATNTNINGNGFSVLGYQSGGILGPTIRVNTGTNANINFQNNLSEKSNIHWHGLKIPDDMDGHPEAIVNSGSSFNYQFVINQRAGLNWYHPHPDGATARQAFQGLAGLFIVNDTEEAALNLPSGIYEVPLVIQDKRLTSSGIAYNPTSMEVMTGYMGETILVNGEASPFTEIATRFYRLRILNGSNARIYNLGLSNNADLIIIGNDGGLLKKPATVKSILLSPGERLDVLVNFSGLSIGSEIFLENKMFDNAGSAQGKQGFKILKFKITQTVNDTFNVPASLSSINSIPATAATRTRNFVLNVMQMSGGMNMTGMHQINGKTYNKSRIDETVSANATEIWEFDNSQGDEPHPIHLHGVHFQVLERTGGRGQLLASESGWKDTVLLLPQEKVKLIIPFASLTGVFVFHCHNLEHEDDGMMLQYQLN